MTPDMSIWERLGCFAFTAAFLFVTLGSLLVFCTQMGWIRWKNRRNRDD